MAAEVECPNCPRCDSSPLLLSADDDPQVWGICPDGLCKVFTWDRTKDAASFEANATPIVLDWG